MSHSAELTPSIYEPTAEDLKRRKFVLTVTGCLGCAGLAAAATPFVSSFEPSARARAQGGPVTADVSGIKPAEMKIIAWRGKPVWLMRRTDAMVSALERPDPALADPLSKHSEQPASCDNATRSVRPDLFVAIGICTHLGCSPVLHLNNAELNAELDAPGGFICPCHGSRFDLAGRVVKNVPAPTNLVIPEYRFTGPSTVHIG